MTVFNDNKPLDRTEDVRFQQLNEAVSFFVNWRANIEDVYGTKSEQAKHFITWQTMFHLKVIFCLAVYDMGLQLITLFHILHHFQGRRGHFEPQNTPAPFLNTVKIQ